MKSVVSIIDHLLYNASPSGGGFDRGIITLKSEGSSME